MLHDLWVQRLWEFNPCIPFNCCESCREHSAAVCLKASISISASSLLVIRNVNLQYEVYRRVTEIGRVLSDTQDMNGVEAPVTTGFQNTSRFVDVIGYADRIELRYTAGLRWQSSVMLICDEQEPSGKFVVLNDHLNLTLTSVNQFALYTAYACPVRLLLTDVYSYISIFF